MKLRTVTRRAFLVGAVAVTGGVLFGTYKYKKPYPNPLLDDLGEGEAAITPFFRIDASGITLITPRADKGQGSYSIQAYLLAEELDIDPLTVALSPGRPDPAYFNGAVLDESAPGLGHFLGKMLGMQLTGGSSTVPDMFERLREAGAVARETLKQVAAQRHGVARSALSTRDGAVVLPDGTRVAYTDLAADAAGQSPIADVDLRDPAEWRYLGKPMPRVDIVDKSTGKQRYGIDVNLPDMVYATVRTNPAMGAPMNSYDASSAQGMRGVLDIVPITGGVAVIADNTWRAFRAANAIEFDWAPGDYPADTDAMWQALESHLEPGSRDHRRRNDGNVDKALGDADVVQATYRTPYLAHAPLEPLCATVKVTDTRVDIWTGTQIPRFVEDHAMEITGFKRDQIHLHVLPIGGSFGQRLEDTYVKQAVEIAMAMPGRPIKMTWTREEDFAHDYPRPIAMGACRGAVSDGKVNAMDLDLVCQSVVTSWFGRLWMAPPGPDATITTGAFDQPYAIDHYRVTGYRAKEMVGVSSWRSVAASQNGFFHESFLDELIHAAGADPVEERLRLIDDPVARRVLEKAAETASWNGPRPGEGRGRGVALVHSFGVPVAEIVDVVQTDRGLKIENVFVACDAGRVLDPVNFEAQVSGGVIWGLGHAMNCELTYENYKPVQTNYHMYQAMRLYQAPKVVVTPLQNAERIRGIGEPGVPPAAPALGNAIFAATGKRIRQLPFNREIEFA